MKKTIIDGNNLTGKEQILIKSLWNGLKEDYECIKNDPPKSFISKIKEKRSEIKQMLSERIYDDNYHRIPLQRKPSAQERMEKGMKSYFFGENGLITKKVPFLKNEYRREFLSRYIHLTNRIPIGALTYLDLEENKKGTLEHSNAFKKGAIRRSVHFCVAPDMNLLSALEKKMNTSPLPKKIRRSQSEGYNEGYFDLTKSSRNKPVLGQSKSSGRFNINFPIEMDTIDASKTMRTRNQSTLSHRSILETTRTIREKCKNINNKYKTLDLEMTKQFINGHISFCKNEEKYSDLFALESLLRKKKEQGRNDAMLSGIKINGKFSAMDPIKATMIKLADTFNKMNDQTAIYFSDLITENYMKLAEKAGLSTKIDINNKKKKFIRLTKTEKSRVNTFNNNTKLKKMMFNIDKAREQLSHQVKDYKF